MDALDDELPADDDEVIVVLLKEVLESVLVWFFDYDVDAVMGVDLKSFGDVGLEGMVLDLSIDG